VSSGGGGVRGDRAGGGGICVGVEGMGEGGGGQGGGIGGGMDGGGGGGGGGKDAVTILLHGKGEIEEKRSGSVISAEEKASLAFAGV